MTARRPSINSVVVVWALLSAELSILPEGAGGVARAVAAGIFIVAGPAIAMFVRLGGFGTSGPAWPLSVRALVAMAYAMPVLPLASTATLLVLGHISGDAIIIAVLLATLIPVSIAKAPRPRVTEPQSTGETA